MMDAALQEKNRKIFLTTLGVAAGMVALSFASVPLYRAICQVTGWGGTTKAVAQNKSMVLDREMTVEMNADTDRNLPWVFRPDLRKVKIKVGQDALVTFYAYNRTKTPVSGSAIYNVTPLKAGKYFNKTQCFCFTEQTLQPGQEVHMPVSFFVDPKIMDDPNMDDIKTITLSYTFYRHDSPELERATEKFYNGSEVN
jgi:cytochrome c oxidase assembly protein subunit 11